MCTHPNAITKQYVGGQGEYKFCPDCWETFGGEETPAKQALIRAAAKAEACWLTPDHDHLKAEGR